MSYATHKLSQRNLLDLLHEARGYNSIDSITGLLILYKQTFIQIIEGENKKIQDLFSRISKDTRHNSIKVLLEEDVKERLFLEWSMGCLELQDPRLSFIPGVNTDLTTEEGIKSFMNHRLEILTSLKPYIK